MILQPVYPQSPTPPPAGRDSKPCAVIFAYHNVGVRCLKVLLAHRVKVALVLTHEDSPTEQIWFDSVASTAADYAIPTRSCRSIGLFSALSQFLDAAPARDTACFGSTSRLNA